MAYSLRIATPEKRAIVPITETVQGVVAKTKAHNGIMHIFIAHTTAAITTADLDPGTDLDMLDAFERIVPKFSKTGAGGIAYRHPHDPAHTPDHILATLIGASLTVPIENGKLVLGEWQKIVLVELDGPRERTVLCSIL